MSNIIESEKEMFENQEMQRHTSNRELKGFEYEAIEKAKIIDKYYYLAEKCKTVN